MLKPANSENLFHLGTEICINGQVEYTDISKFFLCPNQLIMEVFECETCDKTFKNQKLLHRHKKITKEQLKMNVSTAIKHILRITLI